MPISERTNSPPPYFSTFSRGEFQGFHIISISVYKEIFILFFIFLGHFADLSQNEKMKTIDLFIVVIYFFY